MNTTLDPMTASSKTLCSSSLTTDGKLVWLTHARRACKRIPPLWPLQSFVAVNPFVGLTDRPFVEVCELMQRVTKGGMLMSVEYFRQQFASGRINSRDLEEALARSDSELTVAQLLGWLKQPEMDPGAGIQSVAEIATASSKKNWSDFVTQEVSKWCACYCDEGQAAWRMPWKNQPLYTAWKKAYAIDATPRLLGLGGIHQVLNELPDKSCEAIPVMLDTLAVNADKVEDYLHRLLMTLPGWSSYLQYQAGRQGMCKDSLLDLLAVLLVFEVTLMKQFKTSGIHETWFHALTGVKPETGLMIQKQTLWHTALEIGFQRELCGQFKKAPQDRMTPGKARPAVQAVFCIDVRSEVMRRSLECVSAEVETLGFAGFFGMPIEHVPLGQRHAESRLPVLIAPKYRVREQPVCATPEEERLVRVKQQMARCTAYSWNAFRTSAVSSFSFVEAAGVSYAWHLLRDSFQWGPWVDKTKESCCTELILNSPNSLPNNPRDTSFKAGGIPWDDQVQLALAALKNMGLTENFARLVVLCGHGSNTKNNPYAAGLDCGACGGHAGDINARVATTILNEASVRRALEKEGFFIPCDTYFIAALHDTTTDVVRLLDAEKVPPSHELDVQQLRLWFADATRRCRDERAPSLGIYEKGGLQVENLIIERSRDWSQVRPEWGLVNNAAFIVAPRARTQALNLHGRVFLHNYDHQSDSTGSTLELIMTAPMIVTSWINLQYFASTVNHRLWGSGSKVTHNVVGTFGVQQGNGGDLQSGLPIQSLHNGDAWMHEPLRLSVFIEAPRVNIEHVLAKHENVRQLVNHGWLHLYALEEEGKIISRRDLNGNWQMA
ncbi:YbcC family protein [Prosthecobacter dejongeii]|uniref:Probable inorganic carbon transporter subunit DabA n=1 Tax=Prosthecobacter dejongeii TaxID=48465 RepID=A0A7W8DPN9_9BACT|nr:DUF2309 domain-containing protein [Prosthecobacter dejongeii]MBB5037355.1 hypothetical protein [Prosthecobacter dejongeii]